MTPIYELSPALTATLHAAANGDSPVFALVEAREDDKPERKKVLAAELEEINDLINLDLLKDVSADFEEQITHCRIAHGFGYKVVTLTDIGMAMFKDTGKKGVN